MWSKESWDAFQSTVLKLTKLPLVSLMLMEEFWNIKWNIMRQAMKSSSMPDTLSAPILNGTDISQGMDNQYLVLRSVHRGSKAYSLWDGVVPNPSIGYNYL